MDDSGQGLLHDPSEDRDSVLSHSQPMFLRVPYNVVRGRSSVSLRHMVHFTPYLHLPVAPSYNLIDHRRPSLASSVYSLSYGQDLIKFELWCRRLIRIVPVADDQSKLTPCDFSTVERKSQKRPVDAHMSSYSIENFLHFSILMMTRREFSFAMNDFMKRLCAAV